MATVNLHDLATILLHERLLSEPRFKHSHLREINDGSAPRIILPPDTPLPVLDDLPKNIPYLAFFLVENASEIPKIPEPIGVTRSGDYDVSEMELEMYFWGIRHHNSGYTLAHAMQLVLDALPTTTKLQIRTSQGHFLTVPASSFSIVELPIRALTNTYICNMKPLESSESDGHTRFSVVQHVTGGSEPFPWVYMLFQDGVANAEQQSLQVVLDLVSPMLCFRGLGGEIFSMECLEEYHTKLLSQGALEGRPFKHSNRIRFLPSDVPEDSEATQLSERVLTRLSKIMEGETFCTYCGKAMAKSLCTVCRKARYCDKKCQKKGWKYHKTWCKIDARLG
ncbi:hypothetical protein F5887DRAFT_363745 [Amanita rubescens]|nr:hypothetical protein F5887DRAFT_363745 [Amanita rubescens]